MSKKKKNKKKRMAAKKNPSDVMMEQLEDRCLLSAGFAAAMCDESPIIVGDSDTAPRSAIEVSAEAYAGILARATTTKKKKVVKKKTAKRVQADRTLGDLSRNGDVPTANDTTPAAGAANPFQDVVFVPDMADGVFAAARGLQGFMEKPTESDPPAEGGSPISGLDIPNAEEYVDIGVRLKKAKKAKKATKKAKPKRVQADRAIGAADVFEHTVSLPDGGAVLLGGSLLT